MERACMAGRWRGRLITAPYKDTYEDVQERKQLKITSFFT
jgi:hypothetical protein